MQSCAPVFAGGIGNAKNNLKPTKAITKDANAKVISYHTDGQGYNSMAGILL
jgi:hypothetical protein